MSDAAEVAAAINKFSAFFDEACDKVRKGEENPFEFLGSDIVGQMMETLAHLSVQCREHFIKLCFLNEELLNDPNLVGLRNEKGDMQMPIGWPEKKEGWS